MLHYSYQYNLKIVGVPLVNENDFKKKKNKRVLFNILSSEDSYLDIRNVILKVKFS